MSRIGKKPVAVPAGVDVNVASDRTVTIGKGSEKLHIRHRPEVAVAWDNTKRQLLCTVPENRMRDKTTKAYWGLTRALLQCMVDGVTKGYEKKLEVVGVGWSPALQGNKLILNVGFAKPVEIPIPAGLKVTVDKQIITVRGADKQTVGQFAATVRSKRKPEPYNGKGIKYTDEQIIRKEGKAVVGR